MSYENPLRFDKVIVVSLASSFMCKKPYTVEIEFGVYRAMKAVPLTKSNWNIQ